MNRAEREAQEMQEMAQFVFDNGTVLEETQFTLGWVNKTSYVVTLDGYKYYLTNTEGKWSFFHRGGAIL